MVTRPGCRIFLCLFAAFVALTPQVTSVAAAGQPVAHPLAKVDHALFDAILRDRVSDGLVDYAALKRDRRLAAYLTKLARVDLAPLSREERLAYWINTYNAATLKFMADAWPVESIMKLNGGKPWDVPVFRPLGAAEAITLNHIEHEIIRKQFAEPRIHFALVCAAMSCPPLRGDSYTGAALDAQLGEQTVNFLRDKTANRYESASRSYVLSPLFQWYVADFGGDEQGVLRFIASQIDLRELCPSGRAFKDPAASPDKPKADARIRYSDYDWSPNAQK